jgi:uncharacterized protein
MLLDLKPIMATPGDTIPFLESFDLSDLCYGVSYPVSEAVIAEGTVRNTAGVLVMKGTVRTRIHGVCDRCAGEFQRDVSFPIDAVLVTELSSEEDEDENIFHLVGDSADLEEIVRTVFVLNLDSKFLCREDCKGICPRCGKNLNLGKCDCRKEPDPRLAALAQLLEK